MSQGMQRPNNQKIQQKPSNASSVKQKQNQGLQQQQKANQMKTPNRGSPLK